MQRTVSRTGAIAGVAAALWIVAILIGPAAAAHAQDSGDTGDTPAPDTPAITPVAPTTPTPDAKPDEPARVTPGSSSGHAHRRPDAATRPVRKPGESPDGTGGADGEAEPDENSLASTVWDIAEAFYNPGFAIRFNYLVGRMRVVVVSGDETGDTGRLDVTDKFDSRESRVFGFNLQAQNFSLGLWQQRITGRAILEEDITLGDADFVVGEDVNGSFVVNFLSADWVVGTAGLNSDSSAKIEATIGFKLLVMEGELESNDVPGKIGTDNIPVTPPNAGVRVRWSFGPVIVRVGVALFPEIPFAVTAAGSRIKGTIGFDERWITVDVPLSSSVLIRIGYSRIHLLLDVESRSKSSGNVTKGDMDFVLEGAFFTFQWNIS
jgi:hypothetical protein